MTQPGAQLTVTATEGGLALAGEIDAHTAPEFESALHEFVDEHTSARVDLTGVAFMDSSGLRALITGALASRERGGDVVVVPSPIVSRLLEMSGLDQHLTVESGD